MLITSAQYAWLQAADDKLGVVSASFHYGVRPSDSVEHDRRRWCGALCEVAAVDA